MNRRQAETGVAGAISAWKPAVAHLCTVDSSLRYLLMPQLKSIIDLGGTSLGISSPGPDVEFLEKQGVVHIPLSASTRRRSMIGDLRAALQFWLVLRKLNLDVLHTHNPKPGLYGRVLGRMAGVPVVVNTVHGLYATETDPWWKRLLVYLLEGVASRFSDKELVQSREDVDTIRRFRIAAEAKVEHLGNGIDLKRFQPGGSGEIRQAVRQQLGASRDTVVVGCVARLVEEKGIPELIKAWAHRESDYILVIVGPDDPSKPDALDPGLLDEAKAGGVRLLGHREDVQDLYQGFDIFVLPSHREGFPRAAMEAAATGLPLVATDVRGCREVVESGENGILVPKGDIGRLAEAIDALVRDAELRTRMGVAGSKKAVEEFDEERVVERVLASYVSVARAKGLLTR